MVLARRRMRIQQAVDEIVDASSDFSNLWRLVSRWLTQHGCPPPPRPVARLSQHSLRWDEWSSPDKLIHPGDLASIASSEAVFGLRLR